MNKENIHQLEAGRELDRLVAEKVLGWQYKLMSDGIKSDWHWVDANDKFVCISVDDTSLPNFSANIADAWQIVEFLIPQFDDVSVSNTHDGYNCLISPDIWKLNVYVSFGDTAPLAICRCALLAYKERIND